MELIRAASLEEIEQIKDKADLDQGCGVWAFGKDLPAFAITRQCWEVDPIIFPPNFANSKKAMFVWGLEHMLKGAGASHYYFQIHANEEMKEWRDTVQKWGAQPTSEAPEIRFKKVL